LERSRTAGLYALDTGHEKIKILSKYRIQHVRQARMSSLERSRTAELYALDTGQEKIKRMSDYRIEHVQKEVQNLAEIQLTGLPPGKDETDILLRHLLRNGLFTSMICYLART